MSDKRKKRNELRPSPAALLASATHAATGEAENAQRTKKCSWVWCVMVVVDLRRGHGILSYFTVQKPRAELTGLVYGYTEIPNDGDVPLYKRPVFWAVGVAIMFAVL